jgi:hypothetical protein
MNGAAIKIIVIKYPHLFFNFPFLILKKTNIKVVAKVISIAEKKGLESKNQIDEIKRKSNPRTYDKINVIDLVIFSNLNKVDRKVLA